VRKCEANALTTIPDIAHQLCLDTIHKYIDADEALKYADRIEQAHADVRFHLAALLREGNDDQMITARLMPKLLLSTK